MAKEKSKAKKIIIPAVAVVLAAAIVVTGYFCWYRPKHGVIQKSGGGSDAKQSVTITPAEVGYETAEYKGAKVPEPFVEIFEQAEKDSEAACKKYGTALTVGDCEISETEFGMTYFDMFIYAIGGEISDPNGLKPSATSAPAEQAYGADGTTWADRLREATAETLKKRYILFNEALENGFLLSDNAVSELSGVQEAIEYNADAKGVTPDKELAGSYFDGVTVSLYVRNLILRAYADEYETAVTDSFAAAHSDSEIKGIYEKNPSKYNYVDVRVFPIFPEDEEGVKRAKKEVKDLETFYKFGRDYYANYISGYENMQEQDTRRHFTKYDALSEEYGEETAEWCFSADRKAGDVEITTGKMFRCLVFVEKAQYSPESVNFHECITLFNNAAASAQSDSEKENAQSTAQTCYDRFIEEGATDEAIENIADVYNERYSSYSTRGKREKVHAFELEYGLAKWIYSPERKKGDYDIIETDSGVGLYLFDGFNKGDTDAYSEIRRTLAEEEFEKYYNSLEEFNGYKSGLNNTVTDKAAAKGEKACAAYAAMVARNQTES